MKFNIYRCKKCVNTKLCIHIALRWRNHGLIMMLVLLASAMLYNTYQPLKFSVIFQILGIGSVIGIAVLFVTMFLAVSDNSSET